MKKLANQLVPWYHEHGRKDLPWQQSPDAYRIWISEIMLQQTQVATVIPYYQRFLGRFPDVLSLASATEDQVLHLWSGLGYYARARNLHKAARIVVDQHGGNFPQEFDVVLALPGIGRSTAGAILGFAFGQPHSILDGNVKRVLARYHGIGGWPGNSDVLRRHWEVAEMHTPDNHIQEYNQAIMDLGATLCTRTRPSCTLCPLSNECVGHASGTPEQYPGRKEKSPKPVRNTRMIVVTRNQSAVFLTQRPASGIWGGLWAFPEAEDGAAIEEWMSEQYGMNITVSSVGQSFRHTFTHFHLDIVPLMATLDETREAVREESTSTWYEFTSPPELGLAAPTTRLIKLLAGGDLLV